MCRGCAAVPQQGSLSSAPLKLGRWSLCSHRDAVECSASSRTGIWIAAGSVGQAAPARGVMAGALDAIDTQIGTE